MKEAQETKYIAMNDRLYNRASGDPIPDDEPVFILRGRDIHAAYAIELYSELCENYDHANTVRERASHFRNFAHKHPLYIKSGTPLTVFQ
mgnify:CR=1 FL=1